MSEAVSPWTEYPMRQGCLRVWVRAARERCTNWDWRESEGTFDVFNEPSILL